MDIIDTPECKLPQVSVIIQNFISVGKLWTGLAFNSGKEGRYPQRIICLYVKVYMLRPICFYVYMLMLKVICFYVNMLSLNNCEGQLL